MSRTTRSPNPYYLGYFNGCMFNPKAMNEDDDLKFFLDLTRDHKSGPYEAKMLRWGCSGRKSKARLRKIDHRMKRFREKDRWKRDPYHA